MNVYDQSALIVLFIDHFRAISGLREWVTYTDGVHLSPPRPDRPFWWLGRPDGFDSRIDHAIAVPAFIEWWREKMEDVFRISFVPSLDICDTDGKVAWKARWDGSGLAVRDDDLIPDFATLEAVVYPSLLDAIIGTVGELLKQPNRPFLFRKAQETPK
jgi:hypothetical protein